MSSVALNVSGVQVCSTRQDCGQSSLGRMRGGDPSSGHLGERFDPAVVALQPLVPPAWHEYAQDSVEYRTDGSRLLARVSRDASAPLVHTPRGDLAGSPLPSGLCFAR